MNLCFSKLELCLYKTGVSGPHVTQLKIKVFFSHGFVNVRAREELCHDKSNFCFCSCVRYSLLIVQKVLPLAYTTTKNYIKYQTGMLKSSLSKGINIEIKSGLEIGHFWKKLKLKKTQNSKKNLKLKQKDIKTRTIKLNYWQFC